MKLYKTNIGIIGIEIDTIDCETAISEIKFISSEDINNDIKSYESLKKQKSSKLDFQDKVFIEISEYLNGNRMEFSFPISIKGTIFQKKVWEELRKIPYGETRSYKDISIAIGNDKACRAVGSANNKNKLPIIIPCHRVIGKNGKLVGFAGGLDIKEQLLQLEKSIKNANRS